MALRWDTDALWQSLRDDLPGLCVEVLARTDSTNSQLLERARAAGGRRDQPVTQPGELAQGGPDEPASPHGRRSIDVQPCLLIAEQQTQGRGRQGRTWLSGPAGASLCFSLSLPLSPPDWGGLSLAVGATLADALDGASPPRIGLKWPNDLWLLDGDGPDRDAPVFGGRGRKLGGILIETLAVGSRRMVVVGVGLNIAPQSPTVPMASGCACLQEILPALDAPGALHRVARPLVRALLRFQDHGFDAALQARYAQRDLLRGRTVATTAPGAERGVAEGVSERGALRVRTPDQVLHEVASGEVSVRLGPAARDDGAA
jgi:BirA family biotin operon repressor/biotin-[acetyl-CoA-carboxylase] ligase